MRNFKHFEDEIRDVALSVQKELSKVETIGRFSFDIEIEGRIDGDINIVFRCAADFEPNVKGNSISALLTEVMRRKGWQEANAPLCISHVSGKAKPGSIVGDF